jgi:hypothetical protein
MSDLTIQKEGVFAMRKRSFAFGVLLSALAIALTCGAGVAGEGSGGEGSVVPFENMSRVTANDADDAYTQEFLVEDSGAGCALLGPKFDRYGVYYFVRHNAAKTESYILKNYSNTNKEAFATLSGTVDLWDVTPDGDYVYYTLSGQAEQGRLYRLSLKDGGSSTYKEFRLDGEKFLFNSIVLAKSDDEFFLMSPIENLKITIGLFSFDGNTEPSKTWNATLPSNWKGSYSSGSGSGREPGCFIEFEATTDRIWLIAQTHYVGTDNSSWRNLRHWFFSAKITDPGELTKYDPSTEISGWSGNFKTLSIQRYSRNVTELEGTSPFSVLKSVQEYDPVAQTLKKPLTEWTNTEGETVPISKWIEDGDEEEWLWDFLIDAQGNLCAVFKRYPMNGSTWNATFQRFARFLAPAGSAVETPEPDPSVADNPTFSNPSKIVLKTSPFKGPNDNYKATGSRWRVYNKKSNTSSGGISAMADNPIYDERQTQAPYDAHTLTKALLDGLYEWQMAYDWEYSGANETITGSTPWSSLTPFVVAKSGGSGGGCSAFGLGFGALALAGLALLKKRSGR